MEKHWQIHRPEPHKVQAIARRLQCDPVIAAILVNRGVGGEDTAAQFLNGTVSDIRSPFTIKDMTAAVRRIHTALIRREKILVFGDYDADGITATAIVHGFLQRSGAKVSWYIPHRTREGYSLQPNHIAAMAASDTADLIITVDCGSGSFDAVESARSAGIDVIVTDHHLTPAQLPRAAAVVNPNRPDCEAGLGTLAGVGVAFYLLIALRKYLRDKGYWEKRREPNLKRVCDLVAIGTVADMVPLIGDNRILVKTGLSVLRRSARPGIRSLMAVAGIHGDLLDAQDIAFKLAPRLNASGRLAHADTALSLLMAEDAKGARRLARKLDELNTQRQAIEQSMLSDIEQRLADDPDLDDRRSIVLHDSHWHEGVLGIVASRLVRKYGRPALLIATGDSIGKGSGRSVAGVDLLCALGGCADHLAAFGGHAMAAGFRITAENIPRFQDTFDRVVGGLCHADALTPTLEIDAELDFDRITSRLIDQLDMLKPFGSKNPEPLFMARNITVAASRSVGGRHRKMRLAQPTDSGTKPLDAIQFNGVSHGRQPETFDKIAFKLRWNRWNGKRSPQLIVEAT